MNIELAEKIVKFKEPWEMTLPELELVESSVQYAIFELFEDGDFVPINKRKYAMGQWCLGVMKDPATSPVLRHKLKKKYRLEVEYYISNKNADIPEVIKKHSGLLLEIQFYLWIEKLYS